MNIRKKFTIFFKILITGFILYFITRFFNVDFINALKGIQNPFFIIISLIIPLFINPLIGNNRWKLFLAVQNIHEPFLSLVKINFTSIFFGFMLPSSTGYDTIRAYQIEKRHRNNTGSGIASVIIERLLGFLLLSFLGLTGSVISLFYGISFNLVIIVAFIHLSILALIIILKNDRIHQYFSVRLLKMSKGKRIIQYFISTYLAINKFPLKKILLPSIPLIFGFQLTTILCGYLLFLSFNIHIPFFYHLAFIPLIQILSIIPVSLSGFGLREGGFVYFYSLLNVDGNISFMVSLLYFAVITLTPAFIGMLIFLFDRQYNSEMIKEIQKDEK